MPSIIGVKQATKFAARVRDCIVSSARGATIVLMDHGNAISVRRQHGMRAIGRSVVGDDNLDGWIVLS